MEAQGVKLPDGFIKDDEAYNSQDGYESFENEYENSTRKSEQNIIMPNESDLNKNVSIQSNVGKNEIIFE